MKALIIFILATIIACCLANRAKRISGFGGFSTVGGHIGCVVSVSFCFKPFWSHFVLNFQENKLFINGRYTKELTDNEQEELDQA